MKIFVFKIGLCVAFGQNPLSLIMSFELSVLLQKWATPSFVVVSFYIVLGPVLLRQQSFLVNSNKQKAIFNVLSDYNNENILSDLSATVSF